MTRLRSLLFWCHLIAGAVAGVVILIMSATGTALALKPQILNVIDRDVKNVAPSGQPRLPMSQVLATAQAARPGPAVSVAIERDASRAVAVAFERGGTLYVNPYTAEIVGEGSVTAPAFFRTLENWHRWVGLSAENRALAKSVTGASNLAFLLLGLSGLFLWWPHSWTPGHTRAILIFRRTATGRARDFNWHNVIGFWCAPAIIVMTATATVLSYPWANDLLFRAMGSTPPSANREARPTERPAAAGSARTDRAERPRGALTAEQIDWSWSQAETHLPAWSTISLRMQNGGGPFAFTLTDGNHWNAFARSQLTVDPAATNVQRWQPYDQQNLGQKARGWFRFAHTGELAGLPGQIIAGIGCAGGVVLVWTGLSLAVRRLFSWRVRRGVVGARTRIGTAGSQSPA